MIQQSAEYPLDGSVLRCDEGLSFWGGVDPDTGLIIDAQHPQNGESVSGRVLCMPTSRGSCSGSGVLLGLALAGRAPAALVFRDAEEVLTLGALVAAKMFDRPVPVLRLNPVEYDRVAATERVALFADRIETDGESILLDRPRQDRVALSGTDQEDLEGRRGEPARIAMDVIVAMAALQGAERLIDVDCVHIDGCIYASDANRVFAERMRALSTRVRVPATTNAISVDRANWSDQGIDLDFGNAASALADAYVEMGARSSFTCAPYLTDTPPRIGQNIAWAESNAVIYANSVLGARTNKHPDFFDLLIAIVGRAPDVGMYREDCRRPSVLIDVIFPNGPDESVWPLIGWATGRIAANKIPVLRGLAKQHPTQADLKGLCAAFGTTSAAPMLHIEGVTPELLHLADEEMRGLPRYTLSTAELRAAWTALNSRNPEVDLVALGSPHLSVDECRAFAALMDGQRVAAGVDVMLTLGRGVKGRIDADGTLAHLEASGAHVVKDVCWCSITRPLFPINARTVLTNSAKYAHYGPGLSGCQMRYGSLADCASAAVSGQLSIDPPTWLTASADPIMSS